MADEFVLIRLPGSEGKPGKVTRKAFDEIWSSRGFEELSGDERATFAAASSPEAAVTAESTESSATGRRSKKG